MRKRCQTPRFLLVLFGEQPLPSPGACPHHSHPAPPALGQILLPAAGTGTGWGRGQEGEGAAGGLTVAAVEEVGDDGSAAG